VKLLRYGAAGYEKPGILDSDGRIRDLSNYIADITPACIETIAHLDTRLLPLVGDSPRLGVPVAHVGKIVAIGLNYSDHAEETNQQIPTEPIVYLKAISSLSGPSDPVMLPKNARKADWEAELGIVIGSKASYVDEATALDYVAGYCVVNDVSEREYQFERGGTWDKGKGFDTFAPVGPWLVTPDDVGDPQALDIWLDVNGERMQSGNTSAMIFTCAQIISYVSSVMSLHPGDIIITGTPPGAGIGQKPHAVFLKPGDVMSLGVSGLGEQRQEVVAWQPAALRVPVSLSS